MNNTFNINVDKTIELKLSWYKLDLRVTKDKYDEYIEHSNVLLDNSVDLELYINVNNDIEKIITAIILTNNNNWYTGQINGGWELYSCYTDWWAWEITYPILDFKIYGDINDMKFEFEEV